MARASIGGGLPLGVAAWAAAALLSSTGCGQPPVEPDGGARDDGSAAACVSDADCDDGAFCNGTEACSPGAAEADARGCVLAARSPCVASQSCDEDGDLCLSDCAADPDADGDGHEAHECGGTDCDDANRNRFPGNPEVCDPDHHDEDCDPATFGVRDADGDGSPDARCCNFDGASMICGGDCDDARSGVHPSEAESCDQLDNDCDGLVDEGVAARLCRDADGDLHGDPAETSTGCPGFVEGYVAACMDCDDADPARHGAAAELCDGVDNDCDGVVDDGIASTVYPDGDGDGHAAVGAELRLECLRPGFATVADDCDDGDASVYPGAPDRCDGLDNGCLAGGGSEPTEIDADGDGFGTAGSTCAFATDCDDEDPTSYPGAPQLCDGIDNTCSGGQRSRPSEDADGDAHAAPEAPCTGGPLPKDDCDDANPDRYPGAPLLTPRPLAPANGAYTGSLHAPASVETLRPRFRWVARSACAATFELQIDDSCTTPGFDACSFPSPEVNASGLTIPEHRPSAELPVAATAPVGRRYYWRVRSCEGGSCSEWSEVRYVDVGRARSDFDGDGWSDVAVGSPYSGETPQAGRAFVFSGGPSGAAATPSATLENPAPVLGGHFGSRVALAGDVDADGYADLIVGAPQQDDAFLYLGGPDGIGATPHRELSETGLFGVSVAGAGDLDADGFADVAVGAKNHDVSTEEGRVFLYRGGASGISTTADLALPNPAGQAEGDFGASVASAGDLDGDGCADLVIGAPDQEDASTEAQEGHAFVYRGSRSTLVETAIPRTLDDPLDGPWDHFGWAVASAGDLDGDGYADLAITATGDADQAEGEAAAYVYYGGPSGISTLPDQRLESAGIDQAYGFSVASAGDLDGDGDDELVVSARLTTVDGVARAGAVYVYAGSPGGLVTAAARLDNPTPDAGDFQARFGGALAAAGDVNADGVGDLIIGANYMDGERTNEGAAFVYHGRLDLGLVETPSRVLSNPDPQAADYFGESVAEADPRRPGRPGRDSARRRGRRARLEVRARRRLLGGRAQASGGPGCFSRAYLPTSGSSYHWPS